MSQYKYGFIMPNGTFMWAPVNCDRYSNFNKCEDLMLDYGCLPYIDAPNKKNLPVKKYRISEQTIDVTFINIKGKEETRTVNYITPYYEDYSLESCRDQKRKEISDKKKESLEVGLPFQLKRVNFLIYHAQLDAEGKSNILGIKAKIVDGKYDRPESRISFKTYENVVLTLTKQEFLNLADACFDFSEYVVLEKEALNEKIRNSKTREEIRSIKWDEYQAVSVDEVVK